MRSFPRPLGSDTQTFRDRKQDVAGGAEKAKLLSGLPGAGAAAVRTAQGARLWVWAVPRAALEALGSSLDPWGLDGKAGCSCSAAGPSPGRTYLGAV